MCEHSFIVIEWAFGYWKDKKFVLRSNEINGNISPIKRAIELLCQKCLSKRNLNVL